MCVSIRTMFVWLFMLIVFIAGIFISYICYNCKDIHIYLVKKCSIAFYVCFHVSIYHICGIWPFCLLYSWLFGQSCYIFSVLAYLRCWGLGFSNFLTLHFMLSPVFPLTIQHFYMRHTFWCEYLCTYDMHDSLEWYVAHVVLDPSQRLIWQNPLWVASG